MASEIWSAIRFYDSTDVLSYNLISDPISNDRPPQMIILNKVIP